MDVRINWIDWAKALTMGLVVLGHFGHWGKGVILQEFIYSFHMPLFFLLSGYLHKQPDKLKNLLSKNIKTLVVPYILLNLSVFVIMFPYYHYSNISIQHRLFNFIICECPLPSSPCWFLISLFFVKAISFYILKLRHFLRISIVVFLSASCFYISQKLKINIYFSIDAAFIAISFYIAGYYLKQYQIVEKLKNNYISLILIAITFISLCIGNFINGKVDIHTCNFGKYLILFYVDAFIGCAMVVSLCKLLDNMEFNFIKRMSSGTLVILAFHTSLIILFNYVYFHVFAFYPNIPVKIVMSIIIMLLLYYPIILIQKYCPILIGNRKS